MGAIVIDEAGTGRGDYALADPGLDIQDATQASAVCISNDVPHDPAADIDSPLTDQGNIAALQIVE